MGRKGRRTLNIITLISAVLLGGMLVLLLFPNTINPWDHHLSLEDSFHMGVFGRRLAFFNDSNYGSYRGSIIGFVDSQGNLIPPLEREIAFGETLGIYYRYFRWNDDGVLWTLMISLWYPTILLAVLPICWCIRYSIRKKIDSKTSDEDYLQMKYRAICPVCNEQISRWGVWSEKARCKACGASLCQKHDKQYWISYIVFTSLFYLCLYLSFHNLLFIPGPLYVILLMHLLFPYFTQYKVDETVKSAGAYGVFVRILRLMLLFCCYLIAIGIWLGFSYYAVWQN